jgi:hypothetical protein
MEGQMRTINRHYVATALGVALNLGVASVVGAVFALSLQPLLA